MHLVSVGLPVIKVLKIDHGRHESPYCVTSTYVWSQNCVCVCGPLQMSQVVLLSWQDQDIVRQYPEWKWMYTDFRKVWPSQYSRKSEKPLRNREPMQGASCNINSQSTLNWANNQLSHALVTDFHLKTALTHVGFEVGSGQNVRIHIWQRLIATLLWELKPKIFPRNAIMTWQSLVCQTVARCLVSCATLAVEILHNLLHDPAKILWIFNINLRIHQAY